MYSASCVENKDGHVTLHHSNSIAEPYTYSEATVCYNSVYYIQLSQIMLYLFADAKREQRNITNLHSRLRVCRSKKSFLNIKCIHDIMVARQQEVLI